MKEMKKRGEGSRLLLARLLRDPRPGRPESTVRGRQSALHPRASRSGRTPESGSGGNGRRVARGSQRRRAFRRTSTGERDHRRAKPCIEVDPGGSSELGFPSGRVHIASRPISSVLPCALCFGVHSAVEGSVFWLPDRPILHAFPGDPAGTVPPARSPASSRIAQWLGLAPVQFVPGYSDGLAPDSHRLPVSRLACPPRCERHLDVPPRNTLHRRICRV
jgi:hypothetical protein